MSFYELSDHKHLVIIELTSKNYLQSIIHMVKLNMKNNICRIIINKIYFLMY